MFSRKYHDVDFCLWPLPECNTKIWLLQLRIRKGNVFWPLKEFQIVRSIFWRFLGKTFFTCYEKCAYGLNVVVAFMKESKTYGKRFYMNTILGRMLCSVMWNRFPNKNNWLIPLFVTFMETCRVTQKMVITKNRITSKILFRVTQNFRYIRSSLCRRHLHSFKSVLQILFVSLVLKKWAPQCCRHIWIRRAKFSITLPHSSLGIALIVDVIAAFRSRIVWGLLPYTLSLRYPHR